MRLSTQPFDGVCVVRSGVICRYSTLEDRLVRVINAVLIVMRLPLRRPRAGQPREWVVVPTRAPIVPWVVVRLRNAAELISRLPCVIRLSIWHGTKERNADTAAT